MIHLQFHFIHSSLINLFIYSDMEEECFPAISLNRASGRGASAGVESPSPSPSPCPSSPHSTSPSRFTKTSTVHVKEEPFSPASPREGRGIVEALTIQNSYQIEFGRNVTYATSDSEDDEAEYYQVIHSITYNFSYSLERLIHTFFYSKFFDSLKNK